MTQPSKVPKPMKEAPEFYAEIIQEAERGLRHAAIGKAFGISRSMVSRIIRKAKAQQGIVDDTPGALRRALKKL